MKFFALILACVFAAEASIYSCGSYNYWCAHNFWVFPPACTYKCDIKFNKCWLTSHHHSCFELCFPKSYGSCCEPEKDDICAFINTYKSKLEQTRQRIKCELQQKIRKCCMKIDRVHHSYICTFKFYLKHWHCPGDHHYVCKLSVYKNKLNQLKCQAIAKCNRAIAEILCKIKKIHDKAICPFQKCLLTRKSRVDAYCKQLESKAEKIKAYCNNSYTPNLQKQVNWVKSVFRKIYVGKDKGDHFDDAMKTYEDNLKKDAGNLMEKFKKDVDSAIKKMKDCYRCNYKCYFTTGCCKFTQKKFTKSCACLPKPPKYVCKRVSLCAFKVLWEGCKYKNLKTCCENENPVNFTDSAVTEKAQGYKDELSTKVTEWKSNITKWGDNMIVQLYRAISGLNHPRSNATQAEIDSFHKVFQDHADEWVVEKKDGFVTEVTTVENKTISDINDWVNRTKSYVKQVWDKNGCCLKKKTELINKYHNHLETLKGNHRTRLNMKLEVLSKNQKYKFDAFYRCAFGSNPQDDSIKKLKIHYYKCIDDTIEEVRKKFEDYWKEWQPKLEGHYVCTYKCGVSLTLPAFSLACNWTLNSPQVQDFFWECQ